MVITDSGIVIADCADRDHRWGEVIEAA